MPRPGADIEGEVLELLRSPVSGERLLTVKGQLRTESGSHAFRVSDSGIPLFAEAYCSDEGRVQQAHYDRIASKYIENLGYPHTQEYLQYLDRVFLESLGDARLETVAELCCGRGEAFHLLGDRIRRGIGVDVSLSMLEVARRELPRRSFTLLQADATSLPLADGCIDTVVMIGGIHHVNDRRRLFAEVHRILKPGGRFCWREPLSDFYPWRMLRSIVYRLSPTLDHETERPLLWSETVPPLEGAGFRVRTWRPCGLLGFCLLMNSDVLVVNRLFRFVPGIRALTAMMARLDDRMLRLPGLRRAGLLVVGVAEKPHGDPPERTTGDP